jgi:CRP-like cAMP-binding protein
MFEPGMQATTLDAERVRAWVDEVARASGADDDQARLDLIAALEELKGAAEGLQADLAVDVDASVRQQAAERGVPQARQGQGVAHEIALARRESPHRAQQHLGLGRVLRHEMTFTREALRAGRISEWRATIVARETACLSRRDRQEIDRRVAGDPEMLERMGDRELGNAVRRLAYELDAEAWVTRRRIAESERRVTLRPAPDVMARLSAELPVAQGVAVIKSLGERADSLRATGDPRTRGQLMADTLVARLLGSEQATALPVAAQVVVADDVLFGTHEEAAHLDGYGAIPAELARELVKTSAEPGLARLRRLYVKPASGELVAADSRSRTFPGGLARMIELRDQTCRTPWCDAPIRHRDHVVPVADGGLTEERNGQGLCEACNYAKSARGWRARPSPGDRHAIEITTPSGRTYRSTAPPAPRTRVDLRFPQVLAA